jgi:hypothetical protein
MGREEKQFYLLCLIGITFIGGMLILLLWRQNRKQTTLENRSMLFLSLALFSWTIVALYKLYDPPIPSLVNAINDRVLSAFSNMFVLASLPYFPGVFEKMRQRFPLFRKPEQWGNNVFIFFVGITIVFTLIDRNMESDSSKKIIIAIDSLISTSAFGLISYALFQSIVRFWQDKWLKIFLLILFILLVSTQLALPLIAIFPSALKPFYLPALLLLLFGLSFFICICVAYFGIVNMEKLAADKSEVEKNSKLLPQSLVLGYDSMHRHYFISIVFTELGSADKMEVARIETTKLLQPFVNWVLFAVAKKHNVKIAHPDLSITKFRMVDFWNKDSNMRLSQEALFTNDRGLFDLKMDAEQITIENMPFLKSKYSIREAIIKHADSFKAFLASETTENSSQKHTQHEQLIERILKSN